MLALAFFEARTRKHSSRAREKSLGGKCGIETEDQITSKAVEKAGAACRCEYRDVDIHTEQS